jgi:hypothetical protein
LHFAPLSCATATEPNNVIIASSIKLIERIMTRLPCTVDQPRLENRR